MGTHTFIHPDGWKFIGVFALISVLFAVIHPVLGCVGFILTAWCIYFFRNPERVTPTRASLIVSPADGKIVSIRNVVPPKQFDMGEEVRTRISIFLNIFDVHVNRIPIGGVIRKVIYNEGKFFNASLDKASEHNERNAVIIGIDEKNDIAIVQIAGLIARRIHSTAKDDDSVLTGQRFGIIRFGSRADVYLPKNACPLVVEGQYMIAGETVLADLLSSEEQREGDYR